MIATIGIIGGGQLGRMMALGAKRMGYRVIVLDPAEHSPCGQVAGEQIVAAYDDLIAIDELGTYCDVVTYEFENIAIASIERLESAGRVVAPGSHVLRVTQNRLLEKRFARDHGLSTADFAAVEDVDDLARACTGIGFPAILKTARGGYDGKGQWRVEDAAHAHAALEEARGTTLIFERAIPFVRELSVIATRNAEDDVVTYPVAENVHDHGILATSIFPARIAAEMAERAKADTTTVGRKLGIVGTYCVEFFETADGALLLNEIAPRPHNSGHATIDATQCSQYEQHVRAICGLPLAQPRLLSNAIMCNILGAGTGNTLEGIPQLLADPSIVLHLYGKPHAPNRRKMGHFTMLVDGPVDDGAIARAAEARAKLHWS